MKDPVQNIFEGLEGEFNTSEPGEGHFERFNARLKQPSLEKNPKRNSLLPYIAIAASLLMIVTFGLQHALNETKNGLAGVSPEMNETHAYFSTLIEHELYKVEKQKTAENHAVISDALHHIKVLEKEYLLLEDELKFSGSNPRIIYAMVNNFQKRIEILQILINQMEELKSQKNKNKDEKLLV